MIQDVGNIELCDLLETEPRKQWTVILSYWDTGIVCCTCGHFLHKKQRRAFLAQRNNGQSEIRQFSKNFLSVLEYVIKRGKPYGHRYGKKSGDKEYYTSNKLKKKCKKRNPKNQ